MEALSDLRERGVSFWFAWLSILRLSLWLPAYSGQVKNRRRLTLELSMSMFAVIMDGIERLP